MALEQAEDNIIEGGDVRSLKTKADKASVWRDWVTGVRETIVQIHEKVGTEGRRGMPMCGRLHQKCPMFLFCVESIQIKWFWVEMHEKEGEWS